MTDKPTTDISNSMLNSEYWEELWENPESLAAQEKLLEAYLPYARKLLRRIMIRLPSHVRMDDLVNAALIGLHEAICRYNPDSGASFEAFANRRIRGAILDDLRASDPLTRSQRGKMNKMQQIINDWMIEHEEFPADEEIAVLMDMSVEALRLFVDRSQSWLSLDMPVATAKNDAGSQMMLGEILSDESPCPDEVVQKNDIQKLLRQAFRKLDSREQKILYLYYYEDLRLKEIAELFELTEARMCQIHAMAVVKLKTELTKLEETL